MITETERKRIIDLIHQEVVPAIGCTEPIAVALCVAKATETLGTKPEKINVLLSANILKNAMGVGIPGTGMIGLPIAIALGALIGKSEYQLEVLKDSTPDVVEEGLVHYPAAAGNSVRNKPENAYLESHDSKHSHQHQGLYMSAALAQACVNDEAHRKHQRGKHEYSSNS